GGVDWGGQNGQGVPHPDPGVVEVAGGDWTAVAAGPHVCALKTNGTAWCWGTNTYGQAGVGFTANQDRPVEVGGTWRQVSVGPYATCGIQSDLSLWCWGWWRGAFSQPDPAAAVVRPSLVAPGEFTHVRVGNEGTL